ncbi:uncharacterized protein LOC110265017 [Arachis ipaensis]|uniref:uncharacterized protein LOC110265017 n=1 Tax=Arachis ipaensis TaxID=130454 RepID=UPI000A2B88C3|nr:uncharacterized protein LOC110265017 [Arachis ipaensis]
MTSSLLLPNKTWWTMLNTSFNPSSSLKSWVTLSSSLVLSLDGITLSQRKYTLSLLEETGFLGCKPANTPMDANLKLSADEGDPIPDASRYRRLIGRHMYLTISRPDITFAVVKLAQYMANPRTPHLEAVHDVLKYLKAAPGQGLLFSSKSKFHLSMYTDADWGSCLDTRRSTTGYCTFLGDSLVSWKSKKQDVVSRSSTEAEYRALANAACEVLSVISLLKFMHVEVNSTMIFCDNISTIQMATNPTLHERSKHIEIYCHFVREKVAAGIVKLIHVPSKLQLANLLTKYQASINSRIYSPRLSQRLSSNFLWPSLEHTTCMLQLEGGY